jgi:hypothetical protein
MDDFRKRLERLEARVDREQRHTELVFSTQRQIIEKSFDQIRLAMLEQEATLRTQGAAARGNFEELGQMLAILEQRVSSLENPPAA